MDESDLAAFESQTQSRQLISLDEMTENGQGRDNLGLSERLADPTVARPDADLLSAEDRRIVLRALSSLPKTQATVIVLHYLQNIPLRQVAKVLDVTPVADIATASPGPGPAQAGWQRSHAVI